MINSNLPIGRITELASDRPTAVYELRDLARQYLALREAAGRVICRTCGNDGYYGVASVRRGRLTLDAVICPDCADLRTLLKPERT